MRIRFLHRALDGLFALALILAASPAQAGLFRAYLSVNGSDANDCSINTPCRLLPAALAAINDGGEVWMLDSANFNTGAVNVTKSVTILAIPGALASLVVNGGDAMTINTPNVNVTLRNLSFGTLATGGYGIRYFQGASLIVEGCRFSNLDSAGIAGAGSGTLVVKNSVFRNNWFGLSLSGPIQATLDRVLVVDSGAHGIDLTDGPTLGISNSTISGTGDVAINAAATAGGKIAVTIDRSTISNTNNGVYVFAFNAGSTAQVVVTRSILSGNNYGGISNQTSGGTATLVLDDTTVSNNTTSGVVVFGGATVLTRGNNVFNFNATDVTGGTLTPLAGQ